jgi:ribosomal protein L29
MASPKKSTTPVAELGSKAQALYLLRMKKNAGELKETHTLKSLRKEIARELTQKNTTF